MISTTFIQIPLHWFHLFFFPSKSKTDVDLELFAKHMQSLPGDFYFKGMDVADSKKWRGGVSGPIWNSSGRSGWQ